MTENNIKLVNQDGKIVGKDPETGKTVPIEFGESTFDEINSRSAEIGHARTTETDDIDFSIPSDYDSLQEAIDDVSEVKIPSGTRIILNIESGHSIKEGITVEYGDFSHIWIRSEDEQVPIESSEWADGQNFIDSTNAGLPVLDTVVDMEGSGRSQDGYKASSASFGYITSGSGIKNAGQHCIQAERSSYISARNCIAVSAEKNNIYCSGSIMNVEGATAHGAGRHCLLSSRGGTLHADWGVDATNGGSTGARTLQGGTINCAEVDVSGSQNGIFADRGSSVINASLATINNCSATAVGSRGGVVVNVRGAEIQNSGGNGLSARTGGRIVANGCEITNPDNDAVRAELGGQVTATNAILSNAGGRGAYCFQSGMIWLHGSVIENSDLPDLQVRHGGLIFAGETDYDNVSPAVNEIHGAGIIFDENKN